MATYIPDATDKTQPTDDKKASSMGLEFRTLKAYLNDIVVGTILAGKAPKTGEGASGDWPINILGSAASATVALSATDAVNATNVVGNGVVGTTSLDVHHGSIGNGSVKVLPGGPANSGYMGFFNAAGTRTGYFGYADATYHYLYIENGSKWNSNVNIVAPNFEGNLIGSVPWTSVSGRPTSLSQFINDIGAGGGGGGGTIVSFQGRTATAAVLTGPDVTGALGYTPYNASNPSAYATISAVAAAGFQTSSGSVASANSANTAINVNGGYANVTYVNATGLFKGNGGLGNGLGSVYVATGDPTGGLDGDIWLKVAP